MIPAAVKSARDAMQLDSSVWNGREYWMLVQHDGAVRILKQRIGEESTEQIYIPRRTFAAMVEWYLREQK